MWVQLRTEVTIRAGVGFKAEDRVKAWIRVGVGVEFGLWVRYRVNLVVRGMVGGGVEVKI